MSICEDCGQDHSSLPAKWPVGARVRSQVLIGYYTGYYNGSKWEEAEMPIGTEGTIEHHTDDGRPLVLFGEYGAHTFHNPESALELVEVPLRVRYDTLLDRATTLEVQNAQYRQVLRAIRSAIASHQIYDKYTASDIDRVLGEDNG